MTTTLIYIMKDCKLCTNNGKGKNSLKKDRRIKNAGPKISLISLERALGYPLEGFIS